MRRVKLSNVKKFTFVDDEDYKRVKEFNWALTIHGYVRRGKRENGKQTKIYLHRFIMNAPKGKDVDHKDGNTLNNIKSNLRVVERRVNILNKHTLLSSNTSGHTGVFLCKRTGKWIAHIESKGIKYHLGRFFEKTEAIQARKLAELKHHSI